jgi:hypothetical protein
MRIERPAAIAAAVLYLLIAAFQLALALGAPLGRAAFGGYVEQPGPELRIASVIAVLVWSSAALIILKRVGYDVWAPLPRRALPAAVWVLVGLAVVAILPNAITESPLERAIWLPFCLVQAALVITVAVSSRGRYA